MGEGEGGKGRLSTVSKMQGRRGAWEGCGEGGQRGAGCVVEKDESVAV